MNTENSMRKVMESMTTTGSIAKMVEAMDYTSSMRRAMELTTASNSIAKMVGEIDYTSSMRKAMESTIASNSIAKMVGEMDYTSSMRKAMESMTASGSIAKIVEEMDATNTFQKAMLSLAIPRNFQAAIHASGSQLDVDEISEIDNQIGRQLEEMGDAENSESFLRAFTNVPPFLQALMLFILLHILWPVIINITANIVTPRVESLIASSTKTKRELVKDIASISIEDIYLGQYRFVSVENLHLREKASTNSAILDNLQLGQVLTVISRNRNWLEVTYNYSDGEVLRGWVFARYTSKFRE